MKLSSDQTDIVFPAIALATHWHAGVYRKDSFLPYIIHPLEVMKTVSMWRAGDPVMLCAAVCHDLLEDTLCPRESIAALHPEVLELVEELTFKVDESLSSSAKAALKQEYMDNFKNKSIRALVLKCADRLRNSWDFSATNPQYAAKYLNKGWSVFNAVVERRSEVIDRFGIYTLDAIIYDHGELQGLINAKPLG
jgi:(p)ppGpp synthase/HD superfamily hydrolase